MNNFVALTTWCDTKHESQSEETTLLEKTALQADFIENKINLDRM
jgi:hypothetical protein